VLLSVPVRRASLWLECVFHVLAHVETRGLAASCHNRAWIEHAAMSLGLASRRPLGEDARVIAAAANTHDALASVQALAWVFESAEAARTVADRELTALEADAVASIHALAVARSAGPVAEVLRAAAELELPLLDRIAGVSAAQLAGIGAELDAVIPAAPALPRFEVAAARPLGLRGRTLGASIVVGVPGLGCPDAEHAAWQAAHEATVAELATLGGDGFLRLERRAIGLLRSRARAAGLDAAHARWLARLDLSALGPIPDVDHTAD